MFRVPLRIRNAVVSRIKIMANLDITERRLPQSGSIHAKIDKHREVDFRVEVLPVVHGEKVVLRVLDQSTAKISINSLGFSSAELKLVLEALAAPHGMILCTGPTGSGKTTTLGAMIEHLNDGHLSIMTAEDPVEIPRAGISQVSINHQISLTFASVLRLFLRSDPDVIMVGEIRDFETAEISVQAALTGHLLFSTLHTNSAALAITRLANMGIEQALLAASLKMVIAQRLVRKLCPQCPKEPDIITPQQLLDQGFSFDDVKGLAPLRSIPTPGCRTCHGDGYRGRQSIYEVILVEDEMQKAILRREEGPVLHQLAIHLGMRTLRQSGLALVKAGVTTVAEVLRVTMK